MKKVLKVTKVTRLLKISEILPDILSGLSDEDLLEKYRLNWEQLRKIYSKLFYGGFMTKGDLLRRIELREGQDASHIPFVEIEPRGAVYECLICGFNSEFHFSECPRCRQVNLRRLTRRSPMIAIATSAPRHAASS